MQFLEQRRAAVERLPGIVRGEDKPKSAAEAAGFAQLAYHRKFFTAAARLWAEALASEPRLGDDRQLQIRYNAACAAALAASGQGKEEPALDEAAKMKLRRQALDGLRAELTVWGKLFDSGRPQAAPTVVETLKHWTRDSDLSGLRDAEGLAKLPAEERAAFAQLWADVAALLEKAGAKQE
jgi:hypothetical protein